MPNFPFVGSDCGGGAKKGNVMQQASCASVSNSKGSAFGVDTAEDGFEFAAQL